MLIIEGPDNAGKTTLVRQLIELDPGLRLLRRERYKPEHGGSIFTSYRELLLPEDPDATWAHSIVDRFMASECVYGNLFRGGCRMSIVEHITLKGLLALWAPIVVWCDPPNETIRESWQQRDQLYDDPIKIADEYRKRIRRIFQPLAVIRYDWTDDYADRARASIIRAHNQCLQQFTSITRSCQ